MCSMEMVRHLYGKRKGKPPKAPSVRKSYFATCERDKGGRCLPKGQAGQTKDEDVAHSDVPTEEEPKGYQPTQQDAEGVESLESEYPGIEITPDDEDVKYPGIELTEEPKSEEKNPVIEKMDAISKATGMSQEEIAKVCTSTADPYHPDVVKARRKVLQSILENGLQVDNAVTMIDTKKDEEKAKEFINSISKGNKEKAIKEYLETPLYDLQVLSEITVGDKPLPGQAVCYMASRRVEMGSTSVTGDYRHELGHAIHSFFGVGLGSKSDKIINDHYAQVMEKVKANPTKEKMSHEWYEENYGIIGSRGLDNAKEDFAEHYRGYHKAIYQDKYEGGDGKKLEQYKQRHPEMAKLFDAHYTTALFGQDQKALAEKMKSAPPQKTELETKQPTQPKTETPTQLKVEQPKTEFQPKVEQPKQPIQEYNKPSEVSKKMAQPLPTNKWVDVSGWAAHNTTAQWAAKKIQKYEELANAGKWNELELSEFVSTATKPSGYAIAVMQAFQKAKMMQAAKDPGKLDAKQWKKVGGQLGSNPGGQYESPDGKKYYVKFSKSPDHAANEVLASKLYQLAGSQTPTTSIADTEGGLGTASEWMKDPKPFSKGDKDQVSQAAEDFGVHAWLANWDAVGLSYDNQVNVGGKLATVDVGGSILYRAQGSPKAFGVTVSEWNTLRDANINPTAAAVFGNMTSDQLAAAAAKVAKISDDAINKMVDQYGPESKKDQLKKTLIARKNAIAKFAKQEEAQQEKEVKTDTPTESPKIDSGTVSPVVKPSPLSEPQTPPKETVEAPKPAEEKTKDIPPSLPPKPIVTSVPNLNYQKKFDALWEAAQLGDPSKVEAVVTNATTIHTYAKKVHQYKLALLNAMKSGAVIPEQKKPFSDVQLAPESPQIHKEFDKFTVPKLSTELIDGNDETYKVAIQLEKWALSEQPDKIANISFDDYEGFLAIDELQSYQQQLLDHLKEYGITPSGEKPSTQTPTVKPSPFADQGTPLATDDEVFEDQKEDSLDDEDDSKSNLPLPPVFEDSEEWNNIGTNMLDLAMKGDVEGLKKIEASSYGYNSKLYNYKLSLIEALQFGKGSKTKTTSLQSDLESQDSGESKLVEKPKVDVNKLPKHNLSMASNVADANHLYQMAENGDIFGIEGFINKNPVSTSVYDYAEKLITELAKQGFGKTEQKPDIQKDQTEKPSTHAQPKPIKIDPAQFPSVPTFLSSKADFVKQNQQSAMDMLKLASNGQIDELEAMPVQVSQKLQAFKNDLIANLQQQLNPPKKPTKVSTAYESITKVYKNVSNIPSSQKIGRYIVVDDLGGVPEFNYPEVKLESDSGAGGGYPLKDKEMQKQHTDAFEKIKKDDSKSATLIKQYTGHKSGTINEILWAGKDDPTVKKAGELMVKHGVTLPPGSMLYRKINVSDDMIKKMSQSIGKVIQEPQFSSCSIRSGWHGNLQLVIRTSPGTKGLYVGQGVSTHASEEEMLLPPGTRMVITGYDPPQKGTDKHRIHVVALATTPEQCC